MRRTEPGSAESGWFGITEEKDMEKEESSSRAVHDMTAGSPMRGIVRFALPLIFGYILQQMYLVIDAAIVGRWVGVEALAAVVLSHSSTRVATCAFRPSSPCRKLTLDVPRSLRFARM